MRLLYNIGHAIGSFIWQIKTSSISLYFYVTNGIVDSVKAIVIGFGDGLDNKNIQSFGHQITGIGILMTTAMFLLIVGVLLLLGPRLIELTTLR